MCTAITDKTCGFYFGRTLDHPFSYGEEVAITPRDYPFLWRNGTKLTNHYAMIGMAHVAGNYPLYYDAVNEKGLCIAGLNFPGNAVYEQPSADRENVAVFELIPWLLSQFESTAQVRAAFGHICLADIPFSRELPTATLHWMIADRNETIVVESMADGLHIYDNPVGVMTNNPPFDEQLSGLTDYLHLTPKEPECSFSPGLKLSSRSLGTGAVGLPGDLSSRSRFIRAAFMRGNSVSGESEEESVGQFFHILGSVEHLRGACVTPDGSHEITVYTSCCSADRGIYYYTTYENRQITAVDMHRENLDGQSLVRYPLVTGQQIRRQN